MQISIYTTKEMKDLVKKLQVKITADEQNMTSASEVIERAIALFAKTHGMSI